MEDENKTEIDSLFDGGEKKDLTPEQIEEIAKGVTEDPETGLTGNESKEQEEVKYEADYSEYTTLLDAVRAVAEMTSTPRWKRKWATLVIKINEAKNELVIASGKDVHQRQQELIVCQFVMEQEVQPVEALNSFIKGNSLFVPRASALTAGYFDFETGTAELIPVDGPKDVIAEFGFPFF